MSKELKEKEISIKAKEALENEINKQKNKINDLLIELNKKSDEIKKLSKEIELNPRPILVGLNNIGATCFMNSTLQCLSQTKALTDFFLNPANEDLILNNNIVLKNREENKNDYCLTPVYLDLIKQLWDKNGPKSFSPTDFRVRVEQMNPLFKQGQPGDSKDFIIFILEQIHKELKKPTKEYKILAEPFNEFNQKNAFDHFFYETFQKDVSIVSDIFFGFQENTNDCLNCNNIYSLNGMINPLCYNYGIFNCLVFPLEEVKNMVNNNIQNGMNNMQNYRYFNNFYNNGNNYIQIYQNNSVTLYDCFLYYQKTDHFTGDNQNYCKNCKQLSDTNFTSKVYSAPKVLILILNRGKGNEFDVKLDFAEEIDIGQFVSLKDTPEINYDLYGVITHIGESGPNAHFVAACKSQINNQWYRFNDAFVNPINNFKKEIHDFGIPYILFYQKKQ